MKVTSTLIFKCEECSDNGYIYFGNGEEFDVESCSCGQESK
jgi:hypothetical protein